MLKRALIASSTLLAMSWAAAPAMAATSIWDVLVRVAPWVKQEGGHYSPSSPSVRVAQPGRAYRCILDGKHTTCIDIDGKGQEVPGTGGDPR